MILLLVELIMNNNYIEEEEPKWGREHKAVSEVLYILYWSTKLTTHP